MKVSPLTLIFIVATTTTSNTVYGFSSFYFPKVPANITPSVTASNSDNGEPPVEEAEKAAAAVPIDDDDVATSTSEAYYYYYFNTPIYATATINGAKFRDASDTTGAVVVPSPPAKMTFITGTCYSEDEGVRSTTSTEPTTQPQSYEEEEETSTSTIMVEQPTIKEEQQHQEMMMEQHQGKMKIPSEQHEQSSLRNDYVHSMLDVYSYEESPPADVADVRN